MKQAPQNQPAKSPKNPANPLTPIPPSTPTPEEPKQEPQVVEIPADEPFFIGSFKPSPARITGLYPATVVGLKQKLPTGQRGNGGKLIFDLQLDVQQDDGTPCTCEYECHGSWKPESQLQATVSTILSRPLTATEVTGKFNINSTRGERCMVYVNEHRRRAKDGTPMTRDLVVAHIQPMTTTVEGGVEEDGAEH